MKTSTTMVSSYLNSLLNANYSCDYNEIKSKVKKKNEKPSDEKVKESQENVTVKKETKIKKDNTSIKDVKSKPAENINVKPVDKKVNINIKSVNETEQKITARNRKVCPVKVVPTDKKTVAIKVNNKDTKKEKVKKDKDEEHRLHHFIEHLNNLNIQYTDIKRSDTGLYELNIVLANGQPFKISADINGLLYSDDIKFFIGHINPGDEYVNPAIMMTKESLYAVLNGKKIPDKYIISESLFTLNKVLDMQTLKEKDRKKREKIFEKTARAISDPEIYNAILKASNGEAFRFAFCRYMNENEFSIVSSRRNLSSNLSNDKLIVSKEIWINIKDDNVQLKTKKV